MFFSEGAEEAKPDASRDRVHLTTNTSLGPYPPITNYILATETIAIHRAFLILATPG